MSIVDRARTHCINLHEEVNHKYDGQNYSVHLDMVAGFAEEFKDLIPKEDFSLVLTACYGHDLIEDTRETYNDVKHVLGVRAADIIYALTNEKGKTRKERANGKYYSGLRSTEYAAFVKLCDRLANVTYSKDMGSSMFEKYRKENDEFIEMVIPWGKWEFYSPMITKLDNLFK